METWNAVEEQQARRGRNREGQAARREGRGRGPGVHPSRTGHVDQALAEGRQCAASMKQNRTDQEFRRSANALAAELGLGESTGPGSGSLKGRRLSFKGGSMAANLARSIRPDGQKSLAPSGSAVVGQEFTADPVVLVSRR